jgi:hypothetical protein
MIRLSAPRWSILQRLSYLPLACFVIQSVVAAQGLTEIDSAADYDYDIHIAYVGNSYTYANSGFPAEVDYLVSLSSTADGEPAILPATSGRNLTSGSVSQTSAGADFARQAGGFSGNTAIFDGQTAWDWAVLQDQSQIPVRMHRCVLCSCFRD